MPGGKEELLALKNIGFVRCNEHHPAESKMAENICIYIFLLIEEKARQGKGNRHNFWTIPAGAVGTPELDVLAML
jgi:hypothetical protein